jgi:uncharacterized protein
MIFIDTSYLAALALPRDSLHQRANRWAEVISEPLITTDFVVCEFGNGLSKPELRDKLHGMLRWLRGRDEVVIIQASRAWLEIGLELHQARADKSWSLTDCISFEVMKSCGVRQALTNDHHFEQAGFEALLRRDPSA